MVKVNSSQINNFLNDLKKIKNVILIFGPDQGQVSELYEKLKSVILANRQDPFSLSDLSVKTIKEKPFTLHDEAMSLSLSGSNRVIRIFDADDSITKELKELPSLEGSKNYFILTSSNLGPRSTLRKIFEKNNKLLAFACYEDTSYTLEKYIIENLKDKNFTISREALLWLIDNLGGDRGITTREIDKLCLYKISDEDNYISLDDVISCIGRGDKKEYDDLIYATASGNKNLLKSIFNHLTAEGGNFISIILLTSRHFHRLNSVVSQKNEYSLDELIKNLKPPVFFKRAGEFKQQCELWTPEYLFKSLNILSDTEELVKTKNILAKQIVERALLQISGAGARLIKLKK